MPKSYTDKERLAITTDLRAVAMKSMIQKGIKKTTVDELVEAVHIPKGTFYLFYKSKELLLYDAIMEKEEELHKVMAAEFYQIMDHPTVESFTTLLFNFYQKGFDLGIMPLILNGELDLLIRKLPDEIVQKSIAKDDEFMVIFKTFFPKLKEEDVKAYSASFRAIFFTAAYEREIGGDYKKILRMLIKGIVMQMWENNYDDNN